MKYFDLLKSFESLDTNLYQTVVAVEVYDNARLWCMKELSDDDLETICDLAYTYFVRHDMVIDKIVFNICKAYSDDQISLDINDVNNYLESLSR